MTRGEAGLHEIEEEGLTSEEKKGFRESEVFIPTTKQVHIQHVYISSLPLHKFNKMPLFGLPFIMSLGT